MATAPRTKVCVNVYLLEAFLGVINDIGDTPHILVRPSATERITEVPLEYLDSSGRITLNLSPQACGYFYLDKEDGIVHVTARFSGVSRQMRIPVEAIEVTFGRTSRVHFPMDPELVMCRHMSHAKQEVEEVVEIKDKQDKDRSFLKVVK